MSSLSDALITVGCMPKWEQITRQTFSTPLPFWRADGRTSGGRWLSVKLHSRADKSVKFFWCPKRQLPGHYLQLMHSTVHRQSSQLSALWCAEELWEVWLLDLWPGKLTFDLASWNCQCFSQCSAVYSVQSSTVFSRLKLLRCSVCSSVFSRYLRSSVFSCLKAFA